MKVLKGWLLPVALLAGAGTAVWVARERPELLARLKSGQAAKEALRDAPRAVRDSVHEHYRHWHDWWGHYDWWGRYGWYYPAWVIVEQGAAPARSEPASGQAAPARVESEVRVEPQAQLEPGIRVEPRVEPWFEPAARPRPDERPALREDFQAAPAPRLRAAPHLGPRAAPPDPCGRIGVSEPAC